MWWSKVGVVAGCACGVLLWGCSTRPDFVAREEPWRKSDEQACVTAGRVRESPFIHARSALGGPSVCGAAHPYEMTASSDGAAYAVAKEIAIREFSERYLQTLMMEAQGNVSEAARHAGKERRALGRLLKKYGIAPANFR